MSLGKQPGVLILILVSLLAAACGAAAAPTATATVRPPAPTYTPTAAVTPTSTALPTVTATSTPQPIVVDATAPGEWQRVQIAGAGISVEVPRGWQRTGTTWEWSPAVVSSGTRAGVSWADAGGGREPTALLPGPSISLDAEEIVLPWGKGMVHTIQIVATKGGDVLSVERHAVVRAAKRDFDIYTSARTSAELTILRPLLQHMLDSVGLTGG